MNFLTTEPHACSELQMLNVIEYSWMSWRSSAESKSLGLHELLLHPVLILLIGWNKPVFLQRLDSLNSAIFWSEFWLVKSKQISREKFHCSDIFGVWSFFVPIKIKIIAPGAIIPFLQKMFSERITDLAETFPK